MSDEKRVNTNQSEKNINPTNNNQNASQTNQGLSSIITDRLNENPEQQKMLKNQLDINNPNSSLNPNMKSNSTIPQSTSYPNLNWVILESILERNGLATKPTTFSLEVLGIYSLPDFWIKMEQSGAVDAWDYQVKIGEAKCINGKLNMRELTEEEKTQAENKKKPAPKIDKKNPEAVKAEEERLKKIQEEKDMKEKEFYDELKKLEPLDQYYKIKEMNTQADWISFSDEDKINNVELKGETLIDMEDAINDTHKMIIEVNKLPPEDENEKKRPKPKNMNPEDIKPIYSIGLADLTQFYIEPGRKEVILRTPLMMKETYEKRKENNIEPLQPLFEPKEEDLKVYLFGPPQTTENGKKDKEVVKTDKGGKSNNHTENTQNDVDYIEEAHTYIYYKLKFNESINPKIKNMDFNLEKEEKEEKEKKEEKEEKKLILSGNEKKEKENNYEDEKKKHREKKKKTNKVSFKEDNKVQFQGRKSTIIRLKTIIGHKEKQRHIKGMNADRINFPFQGPDYNHLKPDSPSRFSSRKNTGNSTKDNNEKNEYNNKKENKDINDNNKNNDNKENNDNNVNNDNKNNNNENNKNNENNDKKENKEINDNNKNNNNNKNNDNHKNNNNIKNNENDDNKDTISNKEKNINNTFNIHNNDFHINNSNTFKNNIYHLHSPMNDYKNNMNKNNRYIYSDRNNFPKFNNTNNSVKINLGNSNSKKINFNSNNYQINFNSNKNINHIKFNKNGNNSNNIHIINNMDTINQTINHVINNTINNTIRNIIIKNSNNFTTRNQRNSDLIQKFNSSKDVNKFKGKQNCKSVKARSVKNKTGGNKLRFSVHIINFPSIEKKVINNPFKKK